MKIEQQKSLLKQPRAQLVLCFLLLAFIIIVGYMSFSKNSLNLLLGFINPQHANPIEQRLFAESPSPTLTPTPTSTQLNAMTIFNLINDYRVSQGLSRLQWDNDMCLFANKRLLQLPNDHSHSGFNAEIGKTYCSQCRHAGENLAGDQWSEQQLVEGWIRSPEHLANIMQPDYTVTCVATDTIEDHTYSVQEFSSNF